MNALLLLVAILAGCALSVIVAGCAGGWLAGTAAFGLVTIGLVNGFVALKRSLAVSLCDTGDCPPAQSVEPYETLFWLCLGAAAFLAAAVARCSWRGTAWSTRHVLDRSEG